MYARIIVDITHEKLDRVFEYSIPSDLEGMLKVGMEVFVPFGRGNRATNGYIVGFSEKCEYDPEKIKPLLGISEGGVGITAKLVALAAWMKEHYGGTMIQALKTVLPIKKKSGRRKKDTCAGSFPRKKEKCFCGNIFRRTNAQGQGLWRRSLMMR